MGASRENLSALCALVPTATVAYYSGHDHGKGILTRYAVDGKRYAGELPQRGLRGGNAVDLAAVYHGTLRMVASILKKGCFLLVLLGLLLVVLAIPLAFSLAPFVIGVIVLIAAGRRAHRALADPPYATAAA
jgi:hypothetical protein